MENKTTNLRSYLFLGFMHVGSIRPTKDWSVLRLTGLAVVRDTNRRPNRELKISIAPTKAKSLELASQTAKNQLNEWGPFGKPN